jgi:hypothetical protein
MKNEINVARVVDNLHTWQLSASAEGTYGRGSTKIAIPEVGGQTDEIHRHGYWEEVKVHHFHHLRAHLPSNHPEERGRTLVVGRQEAN